MEVFGAGDDSVQSQYSDQIVESSEEDADLGQRVESGDPRGVPSLGNGQFGPQTSARRYSAIHERKLAGDHADPIVDRSASIGADRRWGMGQPDGRQHCALQGRSQRSEEHTSELQSLMRI